MYFAVELRNGQPDVATWLISMFSIHVSINGQYYLIYCHKLHRGNMAAEN